MHSKNVGVILACAGFLTLTNTAHAEDMDFVSDKALCGKELIDRQESGMTLRKSFTTTIEYGCEFEPLDPIDWSISQTQVKVGFCQEPGAIFPGVFVFMTSEFEPGQLRMYQGDSGEATIFYDCNYTQ